MPRRVPIAPEICQLVADLYAMYLDLGYPPTLDALSYACSLNRPRGVAETTCQKILKRAGLPATRTYSYRGHPWHLYPLGKISDKTIANVLGVSSTTVGAARRRLRIAPVGVGRRPEVSHVAPHRVP